MQIDVLYYYCSQDHHLKKIIFKDDISSEPSEFVDEREEEGSVFGQDEILSDYESLEGDPENISDFSKE